MIQLVAYDGLAICGECRQRRARLALKGSWRVWLLCEECTPEEWRMKLEIMTDIDRLKGEER